MFEISNTTGELETQDGAIIKVVGVGGGGCNAVNTMIKSGLTGVEYVVANTDLQALNASLAPTKIQLGLDRTKGLGAGANPEVGKQAALSEEGKLKEVLEGADLVFITAGMGGGTGTGAAPVISKLSKDLGALTVGVVTKPFTFEGKKRTRQALAGIESLESGVDSLITIPNQRLLQLAGESLSLIETFKKADEVLLNAVKGISDLINNTGHINADFADVATVMANKGLSLMGTGIASGESRAVKAAKEAISSPLLEDISIEGATGIIINISGNESLTMHETNEAVTLIMEAADEDAEIIFGTNTSLNVIDVDFLVSNQQSWNVYRGNIRRDGFFNFQPSNLNLENKSIPAFYYLNHNFPNPFNPTTRITYSLPKKTLVSIIIYDLLGKKVNTLIDKELQEPGTKTVQWHGKNQEGLSLSSGVYFYSLETKDFLQKKKMILIK